MDFFSKLPEDVILKILSRNPISSIFCCKRVCKSWHDLIETSEFARCHLPNSLPGVLVHHIDTNYADTDVVEILELEDSLEIEPLNLSYIAPLELKCRNMFGRGLASTTQIDGSTNGLLFVRNPYAFPDALFICNPITNEYMRLPEPERTHENSAIASFGFGASRSTGQYKVVKVSHYRNPGVCSVFIRVCQVYTLGAESWRSSTIPCEMLLDCSCHSSGKLSNGNLFWLARDSDGSWWISCLDLETESFTEFRAPPMVKCRADRLNIGVLRDDRLCLCHNSSISEVHIYLMRATDGDEKLSWNDEYVSIKIPYNVDKCFQAVGTVYVVKSFGNGDLLLARDNGGLYYYSNWTKTAREVERFNAEDIGYFEAISYVPSFLSLKDFETENAKVSELGFSRWHDLL